MMASGIALNIGLNRVDKRHYAGQDGLLAACERDAQDMASIARSQGFAASCLLTEAATRRAVIGKIKHAAKTLLAGDIFMITYAGHGGQLPDLNGDEEDGMDETWCLYDGQLVDDELYALLSGFSQGVRILAVSDSCHSGTVTKAAVFDIDTKATNVGPDGTKYRFMPEDTASRTYQLNRDFYDRILVQDFAAGGSMKASSILIAGCRDDQLSADGLRNGLFTSRLLSTWQDGAFLGDYRSFYKAILKRMPPTQTPSYYLTGIENPAFERQRPFTV